MSDEIDLIGQQKDILNAATKHIAFDGWSYTAWKHGAKDAGIDENTARRLYPGTAASMVALHNRIADTNMVEALAGYIENLGGLENARIRDVIAAAVKFRLTNVSDDREAVRRGITLLALPGNAAIAAKLLYRTVDSIWQTAGDTSTDYNFYTKRALLAGVYSSTLLYWLNDHSEGFSDTWAFLDRRIEDALKIPKLTQAPKRALSNLPNPMRLFRKKARNRMSWA